MNIYVSSTAFPGKRVDELIEISRKEGVNIEFSSSMEFDQDAYSKIIASDLTCLTHNYFPPAEVPFVLNLASTIEDIRSQSLDHCEKAIMVSANIEAPFYAAHAGFCLDPDPEELGSELSVSKVINRDEYWDRFIHSVNRLIDLAESSGIHFLIENNVLTSANYSNYRMNPLLCCDPEEIERLFTEIDHPNVGLLLDTAHLKVSANTLGFDVHEAMNKIKPYVRAIHHSDNDGKVDSNQKLNEDYWFKSYVYEFNELPQVIEVKQLNMIEVHQQIEILSSFAA